MYRRVFQEIKRRGLCYCATVTEGEYAGSKMLYTREFHECLGHAPVSFWEERYDRLMAVEETSLLKEETPGIFVELFMENPRMIIFGGGHVSKPVCAMGKMLGFHVTVMDDREKFLSRDRFPQADRLLQVDFSQADQIIPSYENTYYIIVTRGHSYDQVCIEQILQRPYKYLGMIGSRSKVAHTMDVLKEKGYSQKQLESIHAPIGLPIGGETPEEIAVSIMAEIVQEKNRHYCAYTDASVMEAVEENSVGAMLTIVSKEGSSPRGVGSKMWIKEDGTQVGTIGGGAVEYKAVKDAQGLDGTAVHAYDLSNSQSSSLGMICGGKIQILLERINNFQKKG